MKNEWVIGNDSGWLFVHHTSCPKNFRGRTYSREVKTYRCCWHCRETIPDSIILQIKLLYAN